MSRRLFRSLAFSFVGRHCFVCFEKVLAGLASYLAFFVSHFLKHTIVARDVSLSEAASVVPLEAIPAVLFGGAGVSFRLGGVSFLLAGGRLWRGPCWISAHESQQQPSDCCESRETGQRSDMRYLSNKPRASEYHLELLGREQLERQLV